MMAWVSTRVGAAAALLALSALGACDTRPTILTVHATAMTRAAPDLAIVSLGVVARGGTARAAQEAQSVRMNAVMQAARAAGVEDGEVQTVGYSIEPQYTYPRNASPRITGYVSRNTVTIRVKDLDAVSGLIDATVAEGANELQGINFTFQDEEGSRDAARAQAIVTARARADAYAEAGKMRVARVLSITEPGGMIPSPWGGDGGYDRYARVSLEQSAGAVTAANPPIRPGELGSYSTVTVVYELR